MRPLALLRVATVPFDALASLRAPGACGALDRLLCLESELHEGAGALEQALHDAAGERSSSTDPSGARGRLALLALRRDLHNGRPLRQADLEAAGARLTPSLALALADHDARREDRETRLAAFRTAFADDLGNGRAALLRLAAVPLVEEGIGLASRSLLSRLRTLSRTDPGRWGHAQRHVAAKAVAYLARSATKTSPNGVFCATALAGFTDGPAQVGGAPAIAHVDVILSVVEARKVAACLAIDPDALPAVAPRRNPTLRESVGGWTFWKPASLRNPDDDEVLSRVKEHPAVAAFLEEVDRGGPTTAALLQAVTRRLGGDPAPLASFYRDLVARGLLLAEVEIPYNERRPLRFLASACRAAGSGAPWIGPVEAIESAVDALPHLAAPERIHAMERIGLALEDLPHVRPLEHDALFRLDAASSLDVRLPATLLVELARSLRAYVRLFAAMYPAHRYDAALVRRFLARFPADTDVPFLDLYHGFVEPAELERPAAFPDPATELGGEGKADDPGATMRRARGLLAERAVAARRGEEIVLDEALLHAIAGAAPEPPWACGVLFQIAAREATDLDQGAYRLVLDGLYDGTGLALARFAHLHRGAGAGGGESNPIVRELRHAWSRIARPDAVVAELTYNHFARTANAGLRPRLFEHEIELPGDTASPGATRIPLAELAVRYGSDTRRLALRWVARGVEVLPVISSGVNPVGIVSLLVSLGRQGLQPLGYFPGFDAPGVTHWPRIVTGRLVLFRERWVFPREDWPGEGARGGAAGGEADAFLDVARWRRRHGLPRHVFVHTTAEPKPRYVDLEAPLLVDVLRRALAALPPEPAQALHVAEMLPGPEAMWIAHGRGRYASEFLVQLQSGEQTSRE